MNQEYVFVKKDYAMLDLAKFLCAILVVGIHTQPFGDRLGGAGYFFTTLCRVAVPFFFVTSGYLFFSKNVPLAKYVKRLVLLDIVWTLLELPFIIYRSFIASSDLTLGIRLFHLIKSLLWGESYMGSLYIHASWAGMLVLCWLLRNCRLRTVALFCLFCFILSLLDTSYQFVIADTYLSKPWRVLLSLISPAGSFIVAIPYFFTGMIIHKHKLRIVNEKMIGLVPLLLLLMLVEAFVLIKCSDIESFDNPRFEQFIFLLPFIFFFVVCLKESEYELPRNLSLGMRKLSILIYLLHQPLIIFTYKISGDAMGVFLFFCVVLESIIIGVGIIKLSNRIAILKYLY